MNENHEVDPAIKELIRAMNSTGLIKTVSCCEGHTGHKTFQNPYIALFIHTKFLISFAEILNDCQKHFNYKFGLGIIKFKVEWIYYNRIFGCQEYAPPDYVALDVQIHTALRFKKHVFKWLENKMGGL